LGWPKKCKKGFVKCGKATEEKRCGVFKKDFQNFCCAGGDKDEDDKSKARVSHAGEKVPGGCRLGWPKKCKKGFVECGEAKDEKKCGVFKKDFQKLCCGEDDPEEETISRVPEEEEKPEEVKVKIAEQAAKRKDWWEGGDGPIKPWYDVDGIKSNGPVQDQLKSLLTELGEHQPAMVQANEEMAGEVDKNIKSWTNTSKALQDSHHVFSEAGDAFRDKTWEMHRIMTTIAQRHMKWQGKPVKAGPLGDAMDGVGPEDMQDFVKNDEHEPDMPPGHVSAHKLESFDSGAAKVSAAARDDEAQEKVKTGDHSEDSLPAIEDKSADSGAAKGSAAAHDEEAQKKVETGHHSDISWPAIEDKSAEAVVSHGVEPPDVEQVPGGCQLGWPKKCKKGFVECGKATDQKKCGVFKKDFQKLCCAEENPQVPANKDDQGKAAASKKGGDSEEAGKVLGGCSLGWPKKCKKGFVECGKATEEKQCGVFKKDFQFFCCAREDKDEDDESEARVSQKQKPPNAVVKYQGGTELAKQA